MRCRSARRSMRRVSGSLPISTGSSTSGLSATVRIPGRVPRQDELRQCRKRCLPARAVYEIFSARRRIGAGAYWSDNPAGRPACGVSLFRLPRPVILSLQRGTSGRALSRGVLRLTPIRLSVPANFPVNPPEGLVQPCRVADQLTQFPPICRALSDSGIQSLR